MNKNQVAEVLGNIVGAHNVRIDEPMSRHTSFKVGGPADIFVTPDNIDGLSKAIKILKTEGIPVYIMGNGSNLVVRDKGIRGVVIKILDHFSSYSVNADTITAEAGILLSKISKIALKHELSGLEFAEGIPGTLGGAVAMNAGAYTGDMKSVVARTEYMDKNGEIRVLEGEQHQFGYRTSIIQKEQGIVLRSELKLKYGNRADIKALMDDFNQRRRDKQPLELPSAGSIFKRPEGHFTGKLIEECGLKGYRIGGAEVSSKHCGFIVNVNNATADDIVKLIEHIQHAVKSRLGVELQTEVKILGEE